MDERRVIYIVIDPKKARSGAAAVVGALRGVEGATERVNSRLRASDRAMQSFSRNFGRLQALLITAQPVRFLTGFLRSMIDADKTITIFKSQLFTVTGDLEEAGQAFEYLKDTAQAYAVPINSLTKGFSKLKASMNTPELEQYNEALFQSTAVLSSVLHLAEYNTERVFNVMIQIMSKGQLMMEELKQQLGEHVPGAIALAAESMGYSVADMMDRMQKGLISAEEFAAGWSKLILERFGPAVEYATKSIQAAINRFNNVFQAAMIDLTQSEAGFAIAKMITVITAKMDSASVYFETFGRQIAEVALDVADYIDQLTPDDIERFFKATVDLFRAMIDLGGALISAILFLSTYRDEVKTVAELTIAGWAAIKSYTVAMWAFGVATAASAMRVTLLAGSLALLASGLTALLSGVMGYSLGTWLYDEFEVVRKVGNRIAKFFHVLITNIIYWFEMGGLKLKQAFTEPLAYIRRELADLLRFFNGVGAGFAEFFGFEVNTDNLNFLADMVQGNDAALLKQQINDLEIAHLNSIETIKKGYDELYESIKPNDESVTEEDILDRMGLGEDFEAKMKALREELQRLGKDTAAYSGTSGSTMDDLLGDEDDLRQSLETREEMILRSYLDTQMEIIRMGEKLGLAERDMQQLSARNYQDYNIQMLELQEDRLQKQVDAEKGYWDNVLETMENNLMDGEDLTVRMLDKFTSSVGDAVEEMVFEFTTFEDAFKSLMESMLRALVNMIGQMIAQWVIYQAVQMTMGKSTAAAAALAWTQEALAMQQMAAINSYASTAAIPIVGPPAAPAAAAAAYAATTPMVTAGTSLMTMAAGARAMGGQVQAGETYLVGEKGPELFTAGGTGHVTPNHQMPGNSTNITQVFQLSDNARREAKQAIYESAPFFKQLARQAIVEAASEGGMMSKLVGRRR